MLHESLIVPLSHIPLIVHEQSLSKRPHPFYCADHHLHPCNTHPSITQCLPYQVQVGLSGRPTVTQLQLCGDTKQVYVVRCRQLDGQPLEASPSTTRSGFVPESRFPL